MDFALLILRVVVGLILVGHGTQKLFGWFGGYGLDGTGDFMASFGYRPGRGHAGIAGAAETAGGALLAVGFLTPLAAAMIIGVMINAIVAVHWPHLWNTEGGIEYPVVLATVSAALAFGGPGGWSVDSALGADWSPIGGVVA